MIMKYNVILLLCLTSCLFSCYDDEGNYDYREIDELTITGIPENPVAALYKAENLVVSPTVISKFDGEISADDPNYEFAYYYSKAAGGDFLTPSLLDSAMVKDLNILAEIDPGNYTAWFKVKDLRTNIVTAAEFKLEVSTAMTKGWLVLCEDEGEKVRVDMISEIGERTVISRNILDFLPESHGAIQMYMNSNMVYTGSACYLNLYTKEGSYRCYSYGGNFSRTDYDDPRASEFIRKIDGIIVAEDANYTCMMITAEGDVYQRNSGNATYDVKINVDVPLTEPTYKMAPFIGFRWQRYGYNGVLYDKTNKRFKYFMSYAYGLANGTKYLFDPAIPEEGKLFEWHTGKDMVYMAGTQQGDGLVFALMKNDLGQYSIYGITTGQYQSSPLQTTYIDIDLSKAPRLADATCYAFHPTLPFLIYNNGSDVYIYDMTTRSAKKVLTLQNESISMLKFHKLPDLGQNYPENIQECQYRLAVGSAKSEAETGNEGCLRFYDVPEFGTELSQFGETYTGFGLIKDIAYKGR